MEPIIKEEHQDSQEESQPNNSQTNNKTNPEASSQQNKKNKKVQKKQNLPEDQRQYVCGCGKGYLSYPALYTHIKWKHNGHRIEGTYQPSKDTNGTKGRPTSKKQKPLPQPQIKDLQEQFYTNENLKNYMNDVAQKNLDSLDEEQDYNSIDDVLLFLSEISPSYILEINAENTNPYKELPNSIECQPIALKLEEMTKNKAYFKNDRFNNYQLSQSITLDEVIAHFLFCISLHIQTTIYKEIAYFVQFLMKDYGKKSGTFQSVQDVLITHNSSKFIEYANSFKISDWKNYCNQIQNHENFEIVNNNSYNQSEEIQNVEYILQFLCQFLIEAQYCHK